jgi:hypothetical protein
MLTLFSFHWCITVFHIPDNLFEFTEKGYKIPFDDGYDWAVAREQRLKTALAGTTDRGKVVIAGNQTNVASIYQAASFMGRRR